MILHAALGYVTSVRLWCLAAATLLLAGSPLAFAGIVLTGPPRLDIPGLDPGQVHLPQVTTNISTPPRPPKDEALQAFSLDWLAPGTNVLVLGNITADPGGLPSGWTQFTDVGNFLPSHSFAGYQTAVFGPILHAGVLDPRFADAFLELINLNAFKAALTDARENSPLNVISLEGAGLDLFGIDLIPVGLGRSLVNAPEDAFTAIIVPSAQVPEPPVSALLGIGLLAWLTGRMALRRRRENPLPA